MATEVKHGKDPGFVAQRTGEPFWCQVVGHYTTTPNCAAAGVREHQFKSKDKAQMRAELLALRSAFLEWFREQYEENGGTRLDAIRQVRGITDQWEKYLHLDRLSLGSCAR